MTVSLIRFACSVGSNSIRAASIKSNWILGNYTGRACIEDLCNSNIIARKIISKLLLIKTLVSGVSVPLSTQKCIYKPFEFW